MPLCCEGTEVFATSQHGHSSGESQGAAELLANAGAASSTAARRIETLRLAINLSIITIPTSTLRPRGADQGAYISGLIGGSCTVAARFSLVPRSTPLSSV